MLTKKQIEAIEIGGRDDEWEMSGDLSMDDARELRRLALLGLDREDVPDELLARVAVALSLFAGELGCPPTSGDILGAIQALKERDERAERIGRAVLDTGITANEAAQRARDLRNAIGSLRLSSPAGGRTLEAELRMYEAIADALKEDGNAAG